MRCTPCPTSSPTALCCTPIARAPRRRMMPTRMAMDATKQPPRLVLGAAAGRLTGAGILFAAAGACKDLGSSPPVGVAAMWAAADYPGGQGRPVPLHAGNRGAPAFAHAGGQCLACPRRCTLLAGCGQRDRRRARSASTSPMPSAAIVVGAMIVRAGVNFAWEAMSELMDTGLSPEEVDRDPHYPGQTTPGARHAHEHAHTAHGASKYWWMPMSGQPAH
jgi:hypothetical protein